METRLDHEGIGGHLRLARFVILFVIVGLGSWASLTELSGAVIAAGTVTVESRSKSIQHLDGGIVGDILVRDGDIVEPGDVLLRLNSDDLEEELAGLTRQEFASKAEHKLIEGELDGLRDLKARGLVTNERLLPLERQAARLEGESGRRQAERARLSARIDRAEIRAPIGGYVHALAVHTIGGVVAPGQELLKIVPSHEKLIVEVHVDPRDIDQIREGQEAWIKLVGFNQRSTRRLNGTVTHLSADLHRDSSREAPYYAMRLALAEGEIDRLGGRQIVPGMPAEAYIRTERRTVLGYLLKPLTEQMFRALRED